jgi:iron complex transport system substrate-binding protein
MKRWRIGLWLALLLATGAAMAAIVLQDSTGRTVRLAAPARRIVTLAPHLAELVSDAGAAGRLVGVSSYTDYPPALRRLPVVNSSAAIDMEQLLRLHPDLVIAWASGSAAYHLDQLQAAGIPVLRTEAHHLPDIGRLLRQIGAAAGTAPAANVAAAQYDRQLQFLTQRYGGRRPLRVFLEISHQPLMTLGGPQIVTDALHLCGGRSIFAGLRTMAPVVSLENVIAADPQVIFTTVPGGVQAWQAYPYLTAVRHHQVYAVDGQVLFRATPRMLGAVRDLCEKMEVARRQAAGRH